MPSFATLPPDIIHLILLELTATNSSAAEFLSFTALAKPLRETYSHSQNVFDFLLFKAHTPRPYQPCALLLALLEDLDRGSMSLNDARDCLIKATDSMNHRHSSPLLPYQPAYRAHKTIQSLALFTEASNSRYLSLLPKTFLNHNAPTPQQFYTHSLYAYALRSAALGHRRKELWGGFAADLEIWLCCVTGLDFPTRYSRAVRTASGMEGRTLKGFYRPVERFLVEAEARCTLHVGAQGVKVAWRENFSAAGDKLYEIRKRILRRMPIEDLHKLVKDPYSQEARDALVFWIEYSAAMGLGKYRRLEEMWIRPQGWPWEEEKMRFYTVEGSRLVAL